MIMSHDYSLNVIVNRIDVNYQKHFQFRLALWVSSQSEKYQTYLLLALIKFQIRNDKIIPYGCDNLSCYIKLITIL